MSNFLYNGENFAENNRHEPLPEELCLKIERVRTFFEFENPSMMKVIEEITLFNNGPSTPYFPYKLDKFRVCLQFFDSSGENLAFHSFQHLRPYKNYQNLISVRFPKGNPFGEKEYRLIKLEYITSVPESTLKAANISVTLIENASMYSIIKECEGYEFTVYHEFSFENEGLTAAMKKLNSNTCIELNESLKKLLILDVDTNKQSSFFEMQCNSDDAINGKILIKLKHEIPKSFHNWYSLGLIFGTLTFLFIFFGYGLSSSNNPSNINCYFVLASASVSFLVVLKGWVFQKKMDIGLKTYDEIYRFIIFLIIAEVLYIILRSSGVIDYLASNKPIQLLLISVAIILITFIHFSKKGQSREKEVIRAIKFNKVIKEIKLHDKF